VTLPARYICVHCYANPACREQDVWRRVPEASAVGMMCLACGKVTYVQDAPPNGEAFTGASEVAGQAPVAAPVVKEIGNREWARQALPTGDIMSATYEEGHEYMRRLGKFSKLYCKQCGHEPGTCITPKVNDCRACRHWEPQEPDDERDCAPGVCRKLKMVSLAKAGGCSYSFTLDRRNGRR
jgi:hypothetical protein